MSSPDRRSAPRHVPTFDRIRLGYGEGRAFRQAAARLRDLSIGGAGVALDAPPSWAGPVWIGLEGMPIDRWLLAEVVRFEPDGRGGWRAGLKFAERCPDEFLRGAISGELPWGMPAHLNASDDEEFEEGPWWCLGWPRYRGSHPGRTGALEPASGPRLIDTRYVAMCLGF